MPYRATKSSYPSAVYPANAFIAVLLAAMSACTEAVSPPPKPAPIPATPTAPSGEPTVTHLKAVSGEAIVASAGSTLDVIQLPSVLVTDQFEKPMAGIVVRFRLVGTAQGSLTGDSVVTGASGRASPAAWSLSTMTGSNRLLVTASTLQLSFYAEAAAGPVTTIIKAAGDNLSASVGSQVSQAPIVRLEDKYRNPVPNVPVTFAISTGSGTLRNTLAVSNISGVASVGGWTIGALGGTKLSAKVDGLEPVVFSAYGVPNCLPTGAIAIGESRTGILDESACPVGFGRVESVYTLSLTHLGLRVFSFQQMSGDFQSRLALTTRAGVPIGEVEDSAGTGKASLKAMLLAGEYVVRVSSAGTINAGNYRVESKQEADDVTNCERVFVQAPINVMQSSSPSDCLSVDQRYYDEYVVHLVEGYEIQMALFYVGGPARMDVFGAAGEYVGSSTSSAPYDETSALVHVPRSGFYTIRAGMANLRAIGQYNMMVQK